MRAAAARRRVAHLVETTSPSSVSGAVVVVGGMVMDVRASPFPGHSLTRGTTCPGRVRQTPGGVGRNIAEGVVHIAPPGAPHPFLISAVGDDLAGGALLQAWRGLFDTTSGVCAGVRVCAGEATPTVAVVLDTSGEVSCAVADCELVERMVDEAWIDSHQNRLEKAAVVVLDGNLRPSALRAAAAAARNGSGKKKKTPLLWFEPVSVAKSTRAMQGGILGVTDVVSPNLQELIAMASAARGDDEHEHENETDLPASSKETPSPNVAAVEIARCHRKDIDTLLTAGVGNVVLTLGARGAVLCRRVIGGFPTQMRDAIGGQRQTRDATGGQTLTRPQTQNAFSCTYVPAFPATHVRSLVGAGDALVAGCVVALASGCGMELALAIGTGAAHAAVETNNNVPHGPGVSFAALKRDARGVAFETSTVWV